MSDWTRIELVAIGEELLTGATIDTNAATIAGELETLGVRVVRKVTVGDSPEAIAEAVKSGLERTGRVITTGGLGPTRDDATKAAVAGVFGRELKFRPELWDELKARWGDAVPIPETNRSQAEVPDGAEVFPNPRGTAPGLALIDGDRFCVLLPGVPGEMEAILRGSVLSFLSQRIESGARRPFRRQLRTASIAEAAIADRVNDRLEDLPLEVAYLPEVAGVDIRLTCWAASEPEAETVLNRAEQRLRDILGNHIYARGDTDLAEVLGDLLRERGLTLAVAESCTAGLIAKRLTDWPGASDFLWGGAIVYDNRAKMELAGLTGDALRRWGAVSEETARALAEGIGRRAGVTTAVSVTGIAGPTGGTKQKPVGTVWFGIWIDGEAFAKHRHYAGTRDMIRARAAQGALDLLRRAILERTR